jgi:hypothetical protein
MLFATATFDAQSAHSALLSLTNLAGFNYDPLAGNLLLDIAAPGDQTYALYDGYAAMSNAYGIFSRYTNFGEGSIGYGLVTQFDYRSQDLPEPASLSLAALGFGLAFARNRRR